MNIQFISKNDVNEKFVKLWMDGVIPAITVDNFAEMSQIIRILSRTLSVKKDINFKICGYSIRSGEFRRFSFKTY